MGRYSRGGKTFLGRLLADRAGNTLAIAAASLLPMMALIGGGVDVSRAYMAKTQLQSACDAGVLAGRRAMSKTGTYGTTEKAKAKKMFDFNFNASSVNATGVNYTTHDNTDGQVLGTATATMPTLVMKIFKMDTVDLSVDCMAELQIGNADVMFVLDNTTSMLCAPEDTAENCKQLAITDSKSKFYGLKEAVKDFHKTINSSVNDTRTRIRYGFVPYAMTVNVKDLLGKGDFSTADLTDNTLYQTRVANYDLTTYVGTAGNAVNTSETYSQNITQANCSTNSNNYTNNKYPTSTNSNPVNGGGPAPTATTVTTYSAPTTPWTKVSGSGSSALGTCKRNKSVVTTTYVTKYGFNGWTYKQVSLPTATFKAGTAVTIGTDASKSLLLSSPATYTPIQLASVSGATTSSTTWNGCIEERTTHQDTDFDPVPDNDYDLDFDTDGTTDETRWHPQWANVVYSRSTYAGQTYYYKSADGKYYTSSSYSTVSTPTTSPMSAYCPAKMELLDTKYATLSTDKTAIPADLTTFLATLQPAMYTYHDVGMIWGGRLTSPTGLFKANVNLDSDKISVSKHVIFMTDGLLNPEEGSYSAYGYENMDSRITAKADIADLYNRHQSRFVAMCEQIKAQGTTIWVVAFGTSMTTQLQGCASGGRAYYSSNTTALRNTFKFIAAQVADLRLGA